MSVKYYEYMDLLQRETLASTQSMENWSKYLDGAARNFKYSFNEQLLINSQKPGATAVADYDTWNRKLGRVVKTGTAMYIPVVENGKSRVKNFFDIADTLTTPRSQLVPHWGISEQNQQAVLEHLAAQYDLSGPGEMLEIGSNLENTLNDIYGKSADKYIQSHLEAINTALEGSGLHNADSELDEKHERELAFESVVYASTAIIANKRLGIGNESDISVSFLENLIAPYLSRFNTEQSITALGNAVSIISEECLRHVEAAVKSYDKEQNKIHKESEPYERIHPDSNKRDGLLRTADGTGVRSDGRTDASGRHDIQQMGVPGQRRDLVHPGADGQEGPVNPDAVSQHSNDRIVDPVEHGKDELPQQLSLDEAPTDLGVFSMQKIPPMFVVNWNDVQYDFDLNLYEDGDMVAYDKDGVSFKVSKMGEHNFITSTTSITPIGDILGDRDIPSYIRADMRAYRNGQTTAEQVRDETLKRLESYKAGLEIPAVDEVTQSEQTAHSSSEQVLLSDTQLILENKLYDLSYAHLGNGLTVSNRLEEDGSGDYAEIAHIDFSREISWRSDNLPEDVKAQIEQVATTANAKYFVSLEVYKERGEWLDMIQDVIAVDGFITKEDFSYTPFDRHGGLGKFAQLFGLDDYERVLNRINKAALPRTADELHEVFMKKYPSRVIAVSLPAGFTDVRNIPADTGLSTTVKEGTFSRRAAMSEYGDLLRSLREKDVSVVTVYQDSGEIFLHEPRNTRAREVAQALSAVRPNPPFKAENELIKAEYNNAIVMWQAGNFYEMYSEDAINAASALAVAMTEQSTGVPSAYLVTRIPAHELDDYYKKLIDAGYSVAVAQPEETGYSLSKVTTLEKIPSSEIGAVYQESIDGIDFAFTTIREAEQLEPEQTQTEHETLSSSDNKLAGLDEDNRRNASAPSGMFARLPDSNINADVAGKYSDTHFRISKNGYDSSGRTEWEENTRIAYENEVNAILGANGWTVHKSERGGVSSTATKDRNFLYLHPQDFSGVCENAEREKLVEAFKNAETFACTTIDVYREIFDMTDEELTNTLENARETIENELLEAFTTKRSNLYISAIGSFGADGNVGKRHSVKRLAIEGENSQHGVDRRTEGICAAFASDVFKSLVDSGKIVSSKTKNGIGYRSANKKELEQLQISLAEMSRGDKPVAGIPLTRGLLSTYSPGDKLHYAIDNDGKVCVSNGYFIAKTNETDINVISSLLNSRRRKNKLEPNLNEQILEYLDKAQGSYQLTAEPHELEKDSTTTLVYSDGKQYFEYDQRFVDVFRFSGAFDGMEVFINDNSGYDLREHTMVVKNQEGAVLGVVMPVMVDERLYEQLADVLPLEAPYKSLLERIRENPTNDPYIGREFFDGNETHIVSLLRKHRGEDMYEVPVLIEGKLSRHADLVKPEDMDNRIALWESKRQDRERYQAERAVKAEKEAAARVVYENTHGFADNLPPMQKARTLDTLNNTFYTKEYGRLPMKDFIDAALKDGKSVEAAPLLKKKYYSGDYGLHEYLSEHVQNFYDSSKVRKAYVSVYGDGNADSDYAKFLKDEHPYLHYTLFHDESVLDSSYFNMEYRLMLDENKFFTISKTAHDYGKYLADNGIFSKQEQYPESIKNDELLRNLYDNSGKNEELAHALYNAFQDSRMDGYQSNIIKQRRIKAAIHKVVGDNDEVERYFKIIVPEAQQQEAPSEISSQQMKPEQAAPSYKVGDRLQYEGMLHEIKSIDGYTVGLRNLTRPYGTDITDHIPQLKHEFERKVASGEIVLLQPGESLSLDSSTASQEQSDSTFQGTPMWQDYQFLKDKNPNALLFYRLGDFYEVLGRDARTVSEALDISLTSRDVGLAERVPLAGFPMHKLDEYVKTLTSAGHTVAIRHGHDEMETRSRNMWAAPEQETRSLQVGDEIWLDGVKRTIQRMGDYNGILTDFSLSTDTPGEVAHFVRSRMADFCDLLQQDARNAHLFNENTVTAETTTPQEQSVNPSIQYIREIIAEGAAEDAAASIAKRIEGIERLRSEMQSSLAGLPDVNDSYLGKQRVQNLYQDRLNGFNRLHGDIDEVTAMIAEFKKLTDTPLSLQLSDSELSAISADAANKAAELQVTVDIIKAGTQQAEQSDNNAAIEKTDNALKSAGYDLDIYPMGGNGLVVYNRLETDMSKYKAGHVLADDIDNDSGILAHIHNERYVVWHSENIPDDVKSQIRKIANNSANSRLISKAAVADSVASKRAYAEYRGDNWDNGLAGIHAELDRKANLLSDHIASTDMAILREAFEYLKYWREMPNLAGISADALVKRVNELPDDEAIQYLQTVPWDNWREFFNVGDFEPLNNQELDFTTADPKNARSDLISTLGTIFFTQQERNGVVTLLNENASNSDISLYLSNKYSNMSGTKTVPNGNDVIFETTSKGIELGFYKRLLTWDEIAPLVRSLAIQWKAEQEIEKASETAISPTATIAGFVKSKLETDEKFTSAELYAEATKAYGDTMANNAFTPKDAYDAMELGVNQYILSLAHVSPEDMLNMLDLLPTQTRRTADMEKFQQFSTPPSIAYLANWAANIRANDIMIEPSAGIGGIAVFAKKDGAKVYVNELDKRRLEIIKNLPFDGFFNEDAEQINNIYGGKIEPTVIVMNPPFSSSAERNMYGGKIGAKHIEEALKLLAPNGRLVAVAGQGMADDAPAFRSWWREIKEQYNVKANIGIDGKNYNKYGTTFGVQMLVIDKTGATTEPVRTAFVENLLDVQNILGGIRNDRPSIRLEHGNGNEQYPVAATHPESVSEREPERKPSEPVSDASSGTAPAVSGDRQEQSTASEIDTAVGRTTGIEPEAANVGTHGLAPNINPGRHRGNDGRNDVNNGTGRTGVIAHGQSAGGSQPLIRPPKPTKTELTDSIFENYEPQPLLLENVQPHPANISESAAMSAIQPPSVTYRPNLSQDIIDNGVLSDVQLEAVTYAGQSHSQILPNGNARGFFLGDGTGVGKGRTITGVILDNYRQGRKKAVWLSENTGLVPDAKRDVTALFGNSDLVTEFKGGKNADKSLGNDESILFVTYSALSKGYEHSGSNYEKIVNWLGEDFDGVIVFDEAHNMANSTATKGNRGIKKASQRGMAGLAIQEALPKAKIVYSSATGATEVENLRYAERLGLWGEGTAFPNGEDFVYKIKAGGLAAMELIARDMKAAGVYLSRNISYEEVAYDKIVHELTPEQRQIYGELARSWQIVLQNVNKALETTNQDKDGMAKGKAYSAFWGAQQRFFNQILTAMQVPSMITDIQKQLDDGNSIVVQLVSTNESAQEREFARLQEQDLDLEDFDLTPKQMLMSYIENSFPINQFETYEDDSGNKRSKAVLDSEGKHVINREAVRQKEELLDKLGSIKVPSSALDMIINHFGSDMVAENTGRKRRVVVKDGKAKEENIANKKQADVSAFQEGDKRIIIFSKAGGTGKSYHADKSAKNQQHRVHYLLQAGWQADAAVQGFGRSHRSNQVSAPTFILVTTDLKGQMRFISTIAKRLDQLGALTKGQRQTGSQGLFNAGDNLENAFAADVLAMYYKTLIQNRVDGISDGVSIIEKLGLKHKLLDEYGNFMPNAPELREVNKFLNRILTLECNEQNAVFDGYAERLHIATEKAMKNGTLDKGLENYKADKVVLNEANDIRVDENTGATTKYYNLTAFNKIKPLQFDDVNTQNIAFMGFYQNKNTGAVRAVFQTSSMTDEHGNVVENCRVTGQDGNEYMPKNRLENNWEQLTREKAEELWNKAISELPEFHQSNLHLIGGTVLPVWDKLPTENVRIYRVLTNDGDMLIGRVIPETMIDKTLERLGATREKDEIDTGDLIRRIKSGDTVYLDNDWRIMQKRVSNEQRIEIIGADYLHSDLLAKKGVFTERIGYQTRYFIPAETDTAKILEEVIKISPVSRIEDSKDRIAAKPDLSPKSHAHDDSLSVVAKHKSTQDEDFDAGGIENEESFSEIFASAADRFGAEITCETQINNDSIGENFEVSENGGKGAYVNREIFTSNANEKASVMADEQLSQSPRTPHAQSSNVIPLYLQPKLKPSQHLPKPSNRAKSYGSAR